MSEEAFPASVREMSRLLQEATLTQDDPTPPHSHSPSPSATPATGAAPICPAQQQCGTTTATVGAPVSAGGGVSAVAVAGGRPESPSCGGGGGPVSLSQILSRPVYAASGAASATGASSVAVTSSSSTPSVVTTASPVPSPMPVAAMGNGTSGQSATQPNRHHHNHNHNHRNNHNHQNSNNMGGQDGPPKPVYPEDYNYLKGLVPELKAEVRDRDVKIDLLQAETLDLRRQLKRRTEESTRLQREVHKLKSVLQQHSVPFKEPDGSSSNTLAVMTKKQGVSGESCFQNKTHEKITVQKFDKDFKSKQLIKDAIKDNDFMKHLDSSQVQEIVDSMYPQEFTADSWVIREGEVGSHLYVSAMGEMEVVKDGDVLGKMSSGKAFGELAILYNCTRTASVRACTHVKVWVLDRRVFQQVMMRTGLKRLEDNINFLSSVPLLKKLNSDHLTKIADALEVEFYTPGSYVIRQGTNGDSFFIIRSGKVRVTQKVAGKVEEEEIRTLEKGSYFGEQALLKDDARTANIIAMAPGVECLTLDRESFNQLIGDLSELKEKSYGDDNRGLPRTLSVPVPDSEYSHVRLDELDILATLGVGGFGRVELVQYSQDKSLTFALKCLKKSHIVETQQQEHIYSEKRIMMSVRSPFIARLYKTFRDQKYVYMMMEACLGGEVWTILRDRGFFDDNTARFYAACVVEALEYLHTKNIIYRDLKPENLLLDSLGYVKLVDFGFSKKIGPSSKTWTFCGTPEYVAPEIILNKGHDKAVDYWSIGILMYELLTGTPPFTAGDPMKTYNIILKGIDMIDFPQHVPRNAASLIKRLCREAPSERLGYQRNGVLDIKKHKWFQTFDWESLQQRTLQPPIVPKIRGPTDAANFDSYPRDSTVPADELSGWDLDF